MALLALVLILWCTISIPLALLAGRVLSRVTTLADDREALRQLDLAAV